MTGGLTGELVRLRARMEADVPVLEAELHDDVAGTVRGSRRPWRPLSPGAQASRNRVAEPTDREASFSVVTLEADALAGKAALWGINTHSRSAHIGLALRPAYRGKGLGTDVVRVLCHYGFVVLGLHRIQVDTLADNHAMITAAERVGFRREVVERQATFVLGEFIDEAILGLLAHEWTP
ncbi:MAG TPA: GNAT family protein [Pseudonocardiaceae bacterium]|nr:GNAT family protein [Pseudonocardiaceae bacterium]